MPDKMTGEFEGGAVFCQSKSHNFVFQQLRHTAKLSELIFLSTVWFKEVLKQSPKDQMICSWTQPVSPSCVQFSFEVSQASFTENPAASSKESAVCQK